MSDAIDSNPVLSPQCEAILSAADLYAVDDSSPTATVVAIHDTDGDFRFNVSRAIAPVDLRAIIAFGRRERDAGERIGRGELQQRLRALLGVDAGKAA